MRQILTLALLSSACATQAPVGGRLLWAEGNYRPFTRPAAPRFVPNAPDDEEPTAALSIKHGARDRAVELAHGLVGKPHVVLGGKQYADDCTGLVRGVYAQVGVDLLQAAEGGDNGVTAIYRFAAVHGRVYTGGRPVAGDLVFFRDTYDLNRDGRVNDGLTHIGLVDSVESDGTVQVVHRIAKGVVRYRLNLGYPNSAVDSGGRTVNDFLRVSGGNGKPLLTSQLFAGYATLLPVEAHLAQR